MQPPFGLKVDEGFVECLTDLITALALEGLTRTAAVKIGCEACGRRPEFYVHDLRVFGPDMLMTYPRYDLGP
jgi:hypothetical protein